MIKIYTDGGCDKNPGGTGGWAFRIIDGDEITERSGRVESTTNNRMELMAAVQALESLQNSTDVELFSDSQYLVRGMKEWIFGWYKRGWKLKDGSPVKNVEIWQKLQQFSQLHKIKWNWVRGHADDPNNNRVDKLVQDAMKGKIITSGTARIRAASATPAVKLVKHKGKPVAVKIALKSSGDVMIDIPTEIKIDAIHLQKLIEDLVAALREVEES
ncbi:ribonuclease HI [candidate division LCP-89 bacterium B3_LCP]|uniref:Ribonuclease H n=1 Tax=candidate division LCP-89 bacterium B3_LCP TaxID=2012998 RepID=A0A532UYK2_UNCL8|nr:MAG: ribonuclease HI [candidate division LCP-89 bacterium B3_LCP]